MWDIKGHHPKRFARSETSLSCSGKFTSPELLREVSEYIDKHKPIKKKKSSAESEVTPTGILTCKSLPSRIAESKTFQVIISLAVMVNTAQLGLALEFKTPEWKEFWLVSENLFVVVFCGEMCLKIYCYGRKYFSCWWNILDFAIACIAAFDLWVVNLLAAGSGRFDLSKLAVVRMFRFLRLARVLKLLKLKRQLSVIIEALGASLKSLFWVTLVLFILLYAASLYCVEVIGHDQRYLPTNNDNFDNFKFFGRVHYAMLSLFGICLLAEWSEVVRAVWEVQPLVVLFFIGFVIISTFGLLNVIIGVIVDKTSQVAEKSAAEAVEQRRKEQMKIITKLSGALFRLDADHDGLLTQEEINHAKEDETLYQEFHDADFPFGFGPLELYEMLDVEDETRLTQAKFIEGMFRMIHSTDFQRQCLIMQSTGLLRRQLSRARKQIEGLKEEIRNDLTDFRDFLRKDIECMFESLNGRIESASHSDASEGLHGHKGTKPRARRKSKATHRTLQDEQRHFQDVSEEVAGWHERNNRCEANSGGEGPVPRSGMLPSGGSRLPTLHMEELSPGSKLGALNTLVTSSDTSTHASQDAPIKKTAMCLRSAKAACSQVSESGESNGDLFSLYI